MYFIVSNYTDVLFLVRIDVGPPHPRSNAHFTGEFEYSVSGSARVATDNQQVSVAVFFLSYCHLISFPFA